MSNSYSHEELPAWRIVAYGILAAAGVAAIGYFANEHGLDYLAPIAGFMIAGIGLLAGKARAGSNTAPIARPQKQSRLNYSTITVGVVLVIWSVVAICTGHITVGLRYLHGHLHSHLHTYFLAQDPDDFWAAIVINLGGSAILFFYGFTGRS